MNSKNENIMNYAPPPRSRRLSKLAVVSLMWGIFSSPIMWGIFKAIEYRNAPCPYPAGDMAICSSITAIGVILGILSLLRILPGISRLRGIAYSIGGILAAAISRYPGMMLIYLERASGR
jgi:hypothetical protein